MRRSTYPDGVNIDTTVLEYTEISKAAEILRNRVDWTSRGIYSGGEITVGAVDNTRIDVAAFSGFTPNGEYVECTSNLASIQLDDSTLNAVNYVVAFYTESETRQQPHETDGETYATRAIGSYRVRVYEESAFNGLSATDANLANDAVDRGLILGKVTANGSSVALTASSIESPTSYNSILYPSPVTPANISGVSITAVSSGTSTGAGTLDYTITGPNKQLQWTPAVGGAGALVTLTADGYYSIADGTGEFITVYVTFSQLSSSTPLSDTITIIDLYEQSVPRLTGEDTYHRSMVGTGVPSPENAHGLHIDDLSGSDFSLLQEHRDTQHGSGLWPGSSSSALTGSISAPLGADAFSFLNLSGADILYLNGKKVQSVTPVSYSFEPTVIPSASAGNHYYEIGVSDSGDSYVTTKMSFPGTITVTGCFIVDASENYPVGSGTASLSLSVVGTDYTFTWDSGEPVTLSTSDASQVIRLFAANAVDWIDLYVNTSYASPNPDYNLPGAGVVSDNIVIYPSADPAENYRIVSLCGSWDALAAPARFIIGYPPYAAVGSRSFVDKRTWGTLDAGNISDAALNDLIYAPQDELHYSGVLYSRDALYDNFEIYNSAGLTFDLRGGAYYCRGERISYTGGSVNLIDNTINLVYLNTSGSVSVIDVTADFAGSMSDAVEYLLGRSSKLEERHIIQYPERGCPLYRITASGGAVTDTTNVMRNVNNAVDPWSVADFSTYDQPTSAFNSLYTAFLYAGVQQSSYTIRDITLLGDSTIDEVITQPYGTTVKGRGYVTINKVDATGAWRLSGDCTLSGVNINMSADGGVAIQPSTGCMIANCSYEVSGAANSDVFISSTSACARLSVLNNSVITRSGVLYLSSASSNNVYVEGNYVFQLPNNSGATNRALIQIAGDNHRISDNTIITDNSVDMTPAIQTVNTASEDIHIIGNSIYLQDGAGTVSEIGIEIDSNAGNIFIKDNAVTLYSGASSKIAIGISVDDTSDVTIADNNLSDLGVGVYIIGNSVQSYRVMGNMIKDVYHRGISFELDSTADVGNLFITGNSVDTLTKSATGTAIWGTSAYALLFTVAATTAGSITIHDVSIEGNSINSITSASGAVNGIVCTHSVSGAGSGTLNSFVINNNQVTDVLGASGSSTYLIYATFAGYSNSWGYTVDGNHVATQSTNPSTDTVVGIYSSQDKCSISNNVVNMVGDTAARAADGIICSGDACVVENNLVYANFTGIQIPNSNTLVSGNEIKSYTLGIVSTSGSDKSIFSNNHVEVICAGNVSGIGGLPLNGNFCFAIVSSAANDGYLVENNLFILSGGPADDASACIYAPNSNQFSIKGNETYTTVSALVTPASDEVYHIYVSVDDDYVGDITGNTIHNRQSTDANGIFVDTVSGTPSPHISVNSNTIYATRYDALVSWASGTGTPYELRNDTCSPAVAGNSVVYNGNTIILDDTAATAGGVPKVLLPAGSSYNAASPTSAPTNFGTNVAVNSINAAIPGTLLHWW